MILREIYCLVKDFKEKFVNNLKIGFHAAKGK